jgi:hypothetical protein
VAIAPIEEALVAQRPAARLRELLAKQRADRLDCSALSREAQSLATNFEREATTVAKRVTTEIKQPDAKWRPTFDLSFLLTPC